MRREPRGSISTLWPMATDVRGSSSRRHILALYLVGNSSRSADSSTLPQCTGGSLSGNRLVLKLNQAKELNKHLENRVEDSSCSDQLDRPRIPREASFLQ